MPRGARPQPKPAATVSSFASKPKAAPVRKPTLMQRGYQPTATQPQVIPTTTTPAAPVRRKPSTSAGVMTASGYRPLSSVTEDRHNPSSAGISTVGGYTKLPPPTPRQFWRPAPAGSSLGRWNLSRPQGPSVAAPSPSITPSAGTTTAESGPLTSAMGETAPAPLDYDTAFRNSLDSSRAGVTKQFEMALGDIAQREALAGQALGTLPGQVSDIYGRGDASMGQAAGSLDAAQQASGLTSFMGAGAQMAPLQAAMSGDQAARQADVPLLQMAMQADASRQRGALQQAQLGAMSGIDSQLADYYRSGADRQAQQEFQSQRDIASAEQAMTMRDLDEQQAMRLKNYDYEVGQQKALTSVDKDTGMTRGEMAAIRTTPQYKVAIQYLNGNYVPQGSSKPRRLTPDEAEAMYGSNPQLLKVLATDDPRLAAYIGKILSGEG